METLHKVAVIIPFYRDTLSAYEKIALQQCERVLSAYPKFAIKPQSLTLPDVSAQITLTDTLNFADLYFDGIAGYNRLMLSASFYRQFLDYEYILVYQLDAFVFRDELLSWCNRGVDYIGAPWIRPIDYTDIFKAVKSKLQYYLHTRFNVQVNGRPSFRQFENKVGNGGFSLRRVSKFYALCQQMQPQIEAYLNHDELNEYNEDAFWSVEVNRKRRQLNIPAMKTGLQFAFELSPERALRLNNQQLPFGCHAWDKHADFWRPYFEPFGYEI